MLSAEMDAHLGDKEQQAAGNHLNGYSQKSVTMADDSVVPDIPRDRNGSFDPLLILKYARRFPGFDDKIIALCARGMSTRDIQAHIEEIHRIGVSPSLVSAVTEAVMDEAVAWQNRPLEIASAALDAFEAGPWGQKHPPIVASWRRKWEQVIPFFAFSPALRKILYTTHAIESLHRQVRKTIRNKGHFPSDDAATKLIDLALRQIEAKWKRPPKEWQAAKSQLAIQFGERFTLED